APFLDCPLIKFQHRDPLDVRRIVARLGRGAKPILLTDGLFSHDGSVAPLKSYQRMLPRDALILLDDAHAAGIFGESGKGTGEYAGIGRAQIIQTIALSKAFGVYGGAVLCNAEMQQRIEAK